MRDGDLLVLMEEKYINPRVEGDFDTPVRPTQDFWAAKDPPVMTEEDLIASDYFREQASIMYEETVKANIARVKGTPREHTELLKIQSEMLDDPEAIARWAITDVNWSRHNDVRMGLNYLRLKSANPRLVVAWANVDNMYEMTPDLSFENHGWAEVKQFGRATGMALLSPTTLFGGSLVVRAALGKGAGVGFRAMLRSQAKRVSESQSKKALALRMAGASTLGAVEGRIYGAGVNYQDQHLNMAATAHAPNTESMKFNRVAYEQAKTNGTIAGALLPAGFMAGGAAIGKVVKYGQDLYLSRGEPKGGKEGSDNNIYTDNQNVADEHASLNEDGTVRKVKAVSERMAIIERGRVSLSELIEESALDIPQSLWDEMELEVHGDGFRSPDSDGEFRLSSDDVVNSAAFAREMVNLGVDTVAFTQKSISDESLGLVNYEPQTSIPESGNSSYDELLKNWQMPEDLSRDELFEQIADMNFTDSQMRFIRAMDKADWLGFDNPSQAIDSVFKDPESLQLSSGIKNSLGRMRNSNVGQSAIGDENYKSSSDRGNSNNQTAATTALGATAAIASKDILAAEDDENMSSHQKKLRNFGHSAKAMMRSDAIRADIDNKESSMDSEGNATSYKIFNPDIIQDLEIRSIPQGIPNFVNRYMNPSQYPSIDNGDGTVSTHRMAQMDNVSFPTIVQREEDGELEELEVGDAYRLAMDTGGYEMHENEEKALEHSKNYKSLSNEPDFFGGDQQ